MTAPRPILETLPGEWYWLAIVFGAGQSAYDGIWLSGPRGGDGGKWTAYKDDPPREVGSITFTPTKEGRATLIEITPATAADLHDYWYPALNRLESHAKEAQQMRRSQQITADEAIEYYYRSRAAGGRKITIREVAERFRLSHTALLKHKQRYDAAGKWGSKKDTVSKENLDRTDLDSVLQE
jgi:hypothetical protein